jgi:XRE family transcriptional regulator, regulator of sulfur utilization
VTKKTTFKDFMSDLAAEAKAEGPQAVAQLERLQHRYFLGGQVAMLRTRQGITQDELSTQSGIGQAEISRIERGSGNPTEDTLARLGHALGVRLAYVFERDAVAS